MSRKLWLLLILSTAILSTEATAQRRFDYFLPSGESELIHRVDLGPGPFYGLYVVASSEWETLTLETSSDAVHWSQVGTLERDPHAEERVVSDWLALPSGENYYRLRRRGGGDMTVSWYNPGDSKQAAAVSVPIADLAKTDCPCPLPEVQPRVAWCASGCAPAGSPVSTAVSHLIVHHSAGTNSANDWAAIVRMIYDLHVTGNGWDDVGYNYLIDPNGIIYEGRGNDIRGAHFCGNNTGTMGVCMLGTFTNAAPTAAAQEALAGLLAWKACDRDLDPLGRAVHVASGLNLFHISGHRDGCATACPGDAFYPLLPLVREATAIAISACAPVSTDDPDLESSWRIFPNPARGTFALTGPSGMNVTRFELFDLVGRRVRSWEDQLPTTPFSLAGIPPGHYQLRVGATGKVLPLIVY